MNASNPKLPSNKKPAKLWYRFLQLAIKSKLEINWDIYERWGTPDEVAQLRFETWWNKRGKALFETPSAIEILSHDQDGLTLRVPLSLSVNSAKTEIARLLVGHRPRGAVSSNASFKPTGMVNAKALTQYQRVLTHDLKAKLTGVRMAGVLKEVAAEYEKHSKRLAKQRATMKGSDDPKTRAKARRFSSRDAKDLSARDEGDINLKKGYRWLRQARLVMENVARGEFPGTNYYYKRH